MRLKGKVLELGENTACTDALSVNNISYISMVKEAKSIGCALVMVIFSAIALFFALAQGSTSGLICFLIPLAVGIIWFVAVSMDNSKTAAYNKNLETQITIVMNSGKRFPLACDPDKGPQLFAQLEGYINSVGAGAGDSDSSNASKNNLPSGFSPEYQ